MAELTTTKPIETNKQLLVRYAKSALITFITIFLTTFIGLLSSMIEVVAAGGDVTSQALTAALLASLVAALRAISKILSEPDTMKRIVSAIVGILKK